MIIVFISRARGMRVLEISPFARLWSLRQGDKEVNKRIKQKIYIYILKQTAQYFSLKTNPLQGLKEIYIFCLILHRLAVRISLPSHIFLQV